MLNVPRPSKLVGMRSQLLMTHPNILGTEAHLYEVHVKGLSAEVSAAALAVLQPVAVD